MIGLEQLMTSPTRRAEQGTSRTAVPVDPPGELRRLANQIRLSAMTMTHHAQLGHTGGDLSAADILAVLYGGRVLRIDANQPRWPQRDRFILSKGHCAAALYSVLALHGFFPIEELRTFMDPLCSLNGHPDRNKVPGVEANTGPLGHGLPIAVGCALAARMRGEHWKTIVLTGDGELQEGSNWEAAMSAQHYGLEDLTVIVDRNRLQQGDFTENTIRLDPLAPKWEAFGFAVEQVDGHDTAALLEVFGRLPLVPGKPSCVIAHTIKGKGISFAENQPAWHHGVPTAEQLRQASIELGVDAPW